MVWIRVKSFLTLGFLRLLFTMETFFFDESSRVKCGKVSKIDETVKIRLFLVNTDDLFHRFTPFYNIFEKEVMIMLRCSVSKCKIKVVGYDFNRIFCVDLRLAFFEEFNNFKSCVRYEAVFDSSNPKMTPKRM